MSWISDMFNFTGIRVVLRKRRCAKRALSLLAKSDRIRKREFDKISLTAEVDTDSAKNLWHLSKDLSYEERRALLKENLTELYSTCNGLLVKFLLIRWPLLLVIVLALLAIIVSLLK